MKFILMILTSIALFGCFDKHISADINSLIVSEDGNTLIIYSKKSQGYWVKIKNKNNRWFKLPTPFPENSLNRISSLYFSLKNDEILFTVENIDAVIKENENIDDFKDQRVDASILYSWNLDKLNTPPKELFRDNLYMSSPIQVGDDLIMFDTCNPNATWFCDAWRGLVKNGNKIKIIDFYEKAKSVSCYGRTIYYEAGFFCYINALDGTGEIRYISFNDEHSQPSNLPKIKYDDNRGTFICGYNANRCFKTYHLGDYEYLTDSIYRGEDCFVSVGHVRQVTANGKYAVINRTKHQSADAEYTIAEFVDGQCEPKLLTNYLFKGADYE